MSLISSLLDFVKMKLPYGKAELEGTTLIISLTEDEVKRMFKESLAKSGQKFDLDISIENKTLKLKFRVI